MGVVHGGLQDAELAALGLSRADVLDLSASLNPLGPHPSVLRAAADADLRRYPPTDGGELRTALAEHEDVEREQLMVTAGATAAIHLAVRGLLARGDTCLVFGPTFGEYAAAAEAAGARVLERPVERLEVGAAEREAARLVVLCNPNNPTGGYLDRPRVEALAAQVGAAGATLLLDVAYDPFVLEAWDADELVRAGAPVVVVHSLTKLHAVPGLRLGYAVASSAVVARLEALQPSWAVGATALAAGLAAVRVDAAQRAVVGELVETRGALTRALRHGGLEVRDGRANFVLVRVGDASTFRGRLLRGGFAVRDCTSFGLPEWVRVALPPAGALGRLVPAFLAAAEGVATPGDDGARA